MNKELDENRVHEGHRGRMRAKLVAHGQKIFDTYELLEMLLYYVIPYRDTNPIAKRLLYAFGTLDGVFNASREELLSVNGIGERAADLIISVSRLSSLLGSEIIPEESVDFSDYESVGNFLVDYFNGVNTCKTVGVFLNNNMRLLEIKDVYSLDFESGGVRSKPFIDAAIKNHASVVVTAHNHPHGPLFPTVGDRETNNSLTSSLSKLGILHAEHYLVSGRTYMSVGATGKLPMKLCQSTEVSQFIDGRERSGGELLEKGGTLCGTANSSYNVRDFDYFASLVATVSPKFAKDTALLLLKRYQTVENVLDADFDELSGASSKSVALFMKLLAYVVSRRKTDLFEFQKVHTKVEISEYFKALYLGRSVEAVYLMAFDKSRRAMFCELIGEGVVNSSEVAPRRAIELVVGKGVHSVVIAHNHPFGKPTPSSDDITFTEMFAGLFRDCDIAFDGHYIVAGQLCNIINFDLLKFYK